MEMEEFLSVCRLIENMRWFKCGVKFVINFVKNFFVLFDWYFVYMFVIVFIVYMNVVWYGWVILLFLFLVILRLFFNYFIVRGWWI